MAKQFEAAKAVFVAAAARHPMYADTFGTFTDARAAAEAEGATGSDATMVAIAAWDEFVSEREAATA